MSAALEVAAVVFSLISAFRSGIDVVHRVGDRRRQSRLGRRGQGRRVALLSTSSSSSSSSTPPAPSSTWSSSSSTLARRRRFEEDEVTLTNSLGKAPDEIGSVYEQNLADLGLEFARGDGASRKSHLFKQDRSFL